MLCNSFVLTLIVYIYSIKCGFAADIWFWLFYVCAIITNTNWFRRKEEKWIQQPAEGADNG